MSKKVANVNKEVEDQDELIRENMKCPVCLEVLLPPIYQCETGHNICSSCVEHVHVCPLCKGDYGDTRNYFAEELVNSMSFSCKHDVYGCQTVCVGAKLKEHQDSCEYEPYRCPELACKELMGIGQMGKHMDKHGFRVLKGESHIATIDIQDEHFDKKTEYNPWRISAFGKEFYTLAVRRKDGNWFFWAWFLGLPKEAKAYSYEMGIFSQDKQVVYRGQVQSLRISMEDLMKNENCLVVNDQLIKTLRKDSKINCSVRFIEGKVWEVKKPAKQKTAPKTAKSVAKDSPKKNVRPNSASGVPCPGPPPNTPVSPYLSQLAQPKKKVVPKPKPVTVKACSPQIRLNSGVSYLRRRITEDENQFVNKMRETLKCPGCEQVISPPILQCNIGHNICANCRAVREDCPLCRAPIGISRNFFAEELLYRTVQRCRYFRTGCEVCLPTAQIRLHELTCDFAPFECPFSSCRQAFDPRNLLTHLKSHDIAVVNNELKSHIAVPRSLPANSANAERMCSIPSIVMMDGTAFYPLIVRDAPCTLWSFWVCSSEHGNYKYEIILKKQSKILSFQGPVLSLRMNQAQVLSNGLALITTDRAIKGFKTDNQLDYSLKIAPIRPSYTSRPITFATTLTVDMRKLKASNTSCARTELYANKKTSVSPAERPRVYVETEFDLLDIARLRAPSFSAVSVDDEDTTAEEADETLEAVKQIDKAYIQSSVPNLSVGKGSSSNTNARSKSSESVSPRTFGLPKRTPSIATTSSQTATTIESTHTFEDSFIKEIEASLRKHLTIDGLLPPDFDLMNGRNPILQLPEVIASNPTLPSVGQVKHHENVRVKAWKRKRCLDELKMVLSTRSSIWSSKRHQSQTELIPGISPKFQIAAYRAEMCDTPVVLPVRIVSKDDVEAVVEQRLISNTGLDLGTEAARASGSNSSTRGRDRDTSSTSLELEKPKKNSKKSSKRSAKKAKAKQQRLKNNHSSSSMPEGSSQGVASTSASPNKSSSITIPVIQTPASLDISVDVEQTGFQGFSQSSGTWKNSKYMSGSVSEGEEDCNPCADNNSKTKIGKTRSSFRVKFADQTPVLTNIHPSDSMFHLTMNGRPTVKPKRKSSLKINADNQASEKLPLPTIHEGSSEKLARSPKRKPSKAKIIKKGSSEEFEAGKDIVQVKNTGIEKTSSSDLSKRNKNGGSHHSLAVSRKFDDVVNSSDAFKSSLDSEEVQSFLAEQPLIDFNDASLDIPPTRFDTAMFTGAATSKASLPVPSGSSNFDCLIPRENSKSQLMISECDLLKRSSQASFCGDHPAPAEVEEVVTPPVTDGQDASLVKLPSEGNETINQEDSVATQNEGTQTVEETQTACQVGSSLLKLNNEGLEKEGGDDNFGEPANEDPSYLDQGLDAIVDGVGFTVNAVKSIFSGFVSATTGETFYDDEEDANDSASDLDANGNLIVTNDDYGGYDDNEM